MKPVADSSLQARQAWDFIVPAVGPRLVRLIPEISCLQFTLYNGREGPLPNGRGFSFVCVLAHRGAAMLMLGRASRV